MVLLMAVSFSFAQMKNVKEAKSIANDVKPNFKQAEQLIKEAMKNPETKDLAETWDVAGFIQKRINEEQMKNAFLRKPYDTLKVYNSILKMYEYYTKCDDLAQVPNEKGKIKNKYRKANASSMLAERPNLINGGIQYFNLDKNKEALKFFATYVESASYPMLADKEIAKNDTLLPQIAYYATLAADRVGNKDAIIKYAPMALSDKDGGKFAMQLMADAYKAKGDTVAWIKALEEGILKFPGNDYFFANLVDYYNSSNQASKAMEFADRMLANDPNNKLYLYVKAYLYHNMKEYDNAIEFYKKAIAADPEYAEAYSNVGLVYLMKAQDYADKATTDINDPKYAEAQAVVKKYPKGTYIFRQGDAPLKLYFILEGMVELGSINLNGKITRSSYVTVGEEFGEVELFLRQSAYSGYAKAKSEVSVLEVSQNFFGGRCERNCVHHSKVVFNMLQLFAEKAEKHNRQIEVLTSGNLRQRVAAYLLENCDPDYRVRLHMNREDLAVYLNTTRPSLSRMLLTLQDKGIIRLVGRKVIEITDYERLQEEE